MSVTSERLQVLEMIERGQISPAEGERLLRVLSGAAGPTEEELVQPEPMTAAASSPPSGMPAAVHDEPTGSAENSGFASQPSFRQRWLLIPLWVGVGITVLGALLMGWALQRDGLSFWFACAWLPFLSGVALMALAWSAQKARWLHLRIRQGTGEHPRDLTISLPVPLRLSAWVLHVFRRFIPQLEKTAVDELILALDKTTGTHSPITLEVDGGSDGEHVQIYIG